MIGRALIAFMLKIKRWSIVFRIYGIGGERRSEFTLLRKHFFISEIQKCLTIFVFFRNVHCFYRNSMNTTTICLLLYDVKKCNRSKILSIIYILIRSVLFPEKNDENAYRYCSFFFNSTQRTTHITCFVKRQEIEEKKNRKKYD